MPTSPLTDIPRDDLNQMAGLYIHIPFCKKKCSYCDFFSIADVSLKEPFLKALQQEMTMVSQTSSLCFDTLYIGGGTPSLLTPGEVSAIIQKAKAEFRFAEQTEVTLEVNPGTLDPGGLEQYCFAGVNRVNIGVQSFDSRNLEFLGRIHSVNDAVDAIDWSRRAGFHSIGVDLIYGLPDQNRHRWLLDLDRILHFEPEHISCYMLTYEPGTLMMENLNKRVFRPLSEDQGAVLFEATHRYLEKNGYMGYEVSNFSRLESKRNVDNRSKHNRKYWNFSPYLGMGPSAHSYLNHTRYWNHRNVKGYIDAISKGMLPVAEKEVLTETQQMIETIYLGLRTKEGISIRYFERTFGISFRKIFDKTIEALIEEKMIGISEKRCFLTQKGMVFSDSIANRFIQVLP